MIEFLPLGGADEIGANCYYLNINGTGIILDCGMHPKKTGLEALPQYKLIKDNPVDYVLVSHAHQDHLNGLPFLIKEYPHLKIVTTPQTRAIAELTLHNAIFILSRQIKDEAFNIYSHDEVDLLIKSIDYRSYEIEFDITGLKAANNLPVKAKFYNAGHVLGSAGIEIETDNYRIFYTGDINLSPQSLMPAASLPKPGINTLILECTYGSTSSSALNNWNDEVNRLVISLNKIFNKGGSVLIPVFSFGKMQEILSILHFQMFKGKLIAADIYTGGIGKKINRIYDYNRYLCYPLHSELVLNAVPQNDIFQINNTEQLFKNPSIVLASSGMMVESTISYILAKSWLRKKDSAVFTVGYMDEDTPGFIIKNAKKGSIVKLSPNEKEIEVKCDIKNFRFSAHANREELLEIVDYLNPENVVLVHGDPDAIDWVGAAIIKKYNRIKVFAAAPGKPISFAK